MGQTNEPPVPKVNWVENNNELLRYHAGLEWGEIHQRRH